MREAARIAQRMKVFEDLGDRLLATENEPNGEDRKRRVEAIGGRANSAFAEELYYQLLQGHNVLRRHRRRLGVTYYTYVMLAVLVFLAGLALLAAPFFLLAKGKSPDLVTGGLAALGGVQTVLLLLNSPFDRLTKMMADMTQLLLIIEGYLFQVGLRLIQFDVGHRESVGQAALDIQQATGDTARLIQAQLEGDVTGGQTALLVDRTKASANPEVQRLLEGLPDVAKLVRGLPLPVAVPDLPAATKEVPNVLKAAGTGVQDAAKPVSSLAKGALDKATRKLPGGALASSAKLL